MVQDLVALAGILLCAVLFAHALLRLGRPDRPPRIHRR